MGEYYAFRIYDKLKRTVKRPSFDAYACTSKISLSGHFLIVASMRSDRAFYAEFKPVPSEHSRKCIPLIVAAFFSFHFVPNISLWWT